MSAENSRRGAANTSGDEGVAATLRAIARLPTAFVRQARIAGILSMDITGTVGIIENQRLRRFRSIRFLDLDTKLTWLIAIFILSGCHRPAVDERQLIGTWQSIAAIERHEDGSTTRTPMDPTMEVTFTADHEERWRSLTGEGEAMARWHLEGDDIVFTMTTKSDGGPLGITKRERIEKLSADELIVGNPTMAGVWRRIR